MTYEQLLESAINTYANEMGWEHEDDIANAVEAVTTVFEAIDLKSLVKAAHEVVEQFDLPRQDYSGWEWGALSKLRVALGLSPESEPTER